MITWCQTPMVTVMVMDMEMDMDIMNKNEKTDQQIVLVTIFGEFEGKPSITDSSTLHILVRQ